MYVRRVLSWEGIQQGSASDMWVAESPVSVRALTSEYINYRFSLKDIRVNCYVLALFFHVGRGEQLHYISEVCMHYRPFSMLWGNLIVGLMVASSEAFSASHSSSSNFARCNHPCWA